MLQQQNRRGDAPPISFEEIVKNYSKRVFNLIYSKVQDYSDALDLTQDVFYNAYKGYKKFRGDADIFTWLYRIAVNITNRFLSKRKFVFIDEIGDIQDDTEPNNLLINEEIKERLKDAIGKLHPLHREIIYLKYYDELDYQKISEILGIPVGTVRSRLSRAKKEIMKLMGER